LPPLTVSSLWQAGNCGVAVPEHQISWNWRVNDRLLLAATVVSLIVTALPLVLNVPLPRRRPAKVSLETKVKPVAPAANRRVPSARVRSWSRRANTGTGVVATSTDINREVRAGKRDTRTAAGATSNQSVKALPLPV